MFSFVGIHDFYITLKKEPTWLIFHSLEKVAHWLFSSFEVVGFDYIGWRVQVVMWSIIYDYLAINLPVDLEI